MLYQKVLGIIATVIVPILAQIATLRYMPFGDSITQYGCWRAWIWQQFQQEGYGVKFVGGPQSSTNCNNLNYDRHHEGHPGFQAVNIVRDNQLPGWLTQNPADIITMHLGTNDILLGNHKTAEIIAAFGKLVDQMRANNPIIRIIVAQIIPLPQASKAVQDLNQAIPAWAASKNSTTSPVWVVDQWTNFTNADLKDGIHPSDTGDLKIANRFYPALVQAIRNIQGNATTKKRRVQYLGENKPNFFG